MLLYPVTEYPASSGKLEETRLEMLGAWRIRRSALTRPASINAAIGALGEQTARLRALVEQLDDETRSEEGLPSYASDARTVRRASFKL